MMKTVPKLKPQFLLDFEDIKEKEDYKGSRYKIKRISIVTVRTINVGLPKTLCGLTCQMYPDRIDHPQSADEEES